MLRGSSSAPRFVLTDTQLGYLPIVAVPGSWVNQDRRAVLVPVPGIRAACLTVRLWRGHDRRRLPQQSARLHPCGVNRDREGIGVLC
ncbi:hypothetical protein OG339_48855 (plasmid) [Streptosporangium sp. NBC_01495]|uniref:hypothetical protein n=1 Tax=Streptosporangium sp. NBC_01495 TaxID=2903899 RepID=UPI002E32D10B|nr:hypothetical protein [Streptosporangium sp. NBC_01495]